MANNIKRVRAQISENEITKFIENLSVELENVPAENIYNYDETNLSDDPGRKTILCRRGTKYPEVIINATKVSFTVMFCGNAAGDEVPPYIIYKSEHLWTTWTSNGPKNAKYNRTKSGWIDAPTFEDWFINHLTPILKKKEGRKVVMGDNLSSHINPRVLSECEKHNISFICLPPNATHILQPLDVAYFRPLKCKWRQVLLSWKNSQSGRTLPTTPKDQFPILLKQALESLTETKGNLISGFRKTGIFPIDKEQPLSRLPKQDRIIHSDLIGDSFMQKLKENRANICPEKKIIRKKKINIAPGKSISVEDILGAGPSTSKTRKTEKEIKKRTKRSRCSTSTTSCSDIDMSLASSTEDHVMCWDEEDDILIANIVKQRQESYERRRNSPELQDEANLLNLSVETSPSLLAAPQILSKNFLDQQNTTNYEATNTIAIEELFNLNNSPKYQDSPVTQSKGSPNKGKFSEDLAEDCLSNMQVKNNISDGDYVLIMWNSQKYPGQVTSVVHEEGALVSCMKRGKLFWRWPVYKDEQIYPWNNIICKINIPKFEKKGCFSVPELDN